MPEFGPIHLLLAGGGTGGHIFPLAALHALLGGEEGGVKATYAGIRGRIDETIMPQVARTYVLQAIGQAAGVIGRIRFLVQALRWTVYWLRRMRSFDLVAISGGYGSVPALLAARISGTPVLVYEPNAVEGRASRLARYLGIASLNPLAGGCEPLIRPALYPASECQGDCLLVAGGSQGSLSLNRILLHEDVMESLLRNLKVEKVCWLTGETGYQEVYDRFGADARFDIRQYTSDMPALYATARYGIARAGASSIFELAAWGIPAVYVPLPWSADGHQLANARHAATKGWGVVCEEKEGPEGLKNATATLQNMLCDNDIPTVNSAQEFWRQKVHAMLGVTQ